MDNPRKIEEDCCPHCNKVISKKITSYDLPPEIIAIAKELGINISNFKHR